MGSYGICPSCSSYKYLNGKICKSCTYNTGRCVACKRVAKIYVDGLCYLCYQDGQVLAKIEHLQVSFVPFNDYNKQIFQLYLGYIKRYRLYYAHVKLTKDLGAILQSNAIPTIKTWHDIFTLSKHHMIFQKPHKKQGCAFIKIGNMLAELGIIAPRENDLCHQINNHLKHFSTTRVQDFINSLLKINTAEESVLHYLNSLERLEVFSIKEFGVDSLLLLDRFHLVQFFDMAQKLDLGLQNQRKIFFQINKFYKWAMLNRLILKNPCPQLELGRPSSKILICSQEQYLNLKSFIRNPDTDPESAMLLSLILFFGFSTVQLAQAQLINQDDCCIPATMSYSYFPAIMS